MDSREGIQSCRLPPGKEYHVFLSYRDVDGDREWVRVLAEKLKTEYNLICCDHSTDFQPGKKIVENIKHAVTRSVKTLLILSNEYLNSYWCNYEVDFTHQMSMETRQKLIIPVLKEDCDIPDHIKPLTYIDARGDMELWIPRLVAAIYSPVYGSKDSHAFYDPDDCFRNLETVYEVSSTMGCCGRFPFNTTNYVPDALNKRHFNIDADLYNQVLKEISKSGFFRKRLCCLPSCPSSICFLVILGALTFWFVMAIVSVQQINRRNANLDTSTVNGNSTNGTIQIPVAFIPLVFLSLVAILWPIGCCIYCYQKRQCFHETLVNVNRKLIHHNLIIAYRMVRRSATMKFVFIYYNYQPCLDYMYSILTGELMKQEETTESHAPTFEETTQLLDDNILGTVLTSVNMTDLTTVFDMETSETHVDDVCFKTDNENDKDDEIIPLIQEGPADNEETVENIIKEYTEATIINLSADYIQDFIVEKMNNSATKRHTSRGLCLCQYAELKRPKADNTDERRIIVV